MNELWRGLVALKMICEAAKTEGLENDDMFYHPYISLITSNGNRIDEPDLKIITRYDDK